MRGWGKGGNRGEDEGCVCVGGGGGGGGMLGGRVSRGK